MKIEGYFASQETHFFEKRNEKQITDKKFLEVDISLSCKKEFNH